MDSLSVIAWRFILEQKIDELPVDPFRLIEQNNWTIFTYTEFSQIVHRPVESIIMNYEKDGFAFWSQRDQNFVICYNDSFSFSICRWTILHEIAHIHLKHISSATPLLSRVRKQGHPFFEKEAQGFARRVLCPSIVLHNCKAIEAEEIMHLCGISREAAIYRSDYMKLLETRNKFGVHPLEREVEEQFAPFVETYLQQKEPTFWLARIVVREVI